MTWASITHVKHATNYLRWIWFKDTSATQLYSGICAMPPAVSCEISPVALKIVLMYRIMYDVIIIIIVISLMSVSLHWKFLQECRHKFPCEHGLDSSPTTMRMLEQNFTPDTLPGTTPANLNWSPSFCRMTNSLWHKHHLARQREQMTVYLTALWPLFYQHACII